MVFVSVANEWFELPCCPMLFVAFWVFVYKFEVIASNPITKDKPS